MQKSIRSSTCRKAGYSRAAEECGGSSVLLVLGATLAILLISALVSGQARQELRMSAAETEAAQVEAVVTGAFAAAARKAQELPEWPSLGDPEYSDGAASCNADPGFGGTYPATCTQALERRQVASITYGPVDQIPLRVVWKASAAGEQQSAYGWILIDPDSDDVMGVWRDQHWCTPDPSYVPGESILGPCKQGG